MPVFSLLRNRIFVATLLTLGALLLVSAACGGDDEEGETPVPGETPAGGETPTDQTPAGGAEAEIQMIPSIQFDKNELTIPAGQDVTVTADNTDEGVRHNFAVYTQDPDEGGEPLGNTEICQAPCTETVTLNLDAGEFYFQCNVHPQQMTGTLIVDGDAEGAGASTRY